MQLILQEKQLVEIIKSWAVDNLPTFDVQCVKFDFGSKDMKVLIDLEDQGKEKQ